MKKLFFAVAAIVAISACSKTEVDKASTRKVINFSAVSGKTTKAPISGTTYKTTDPTFGIFAYALEEGKTWAANSADGQTYMDNVEISYNATDLIWEPAKTYYWPLSGSLTFVGYSPYGCNGTVAYAPATKALTVTDFTQVATAADQEDLMWATTNPDLTDNQSTYTSESATSTKTGVNEVFHHALSQVCFAIKKAAGLEDYVITVDTIKFNAYSKGTLTVTNDVPAWASQSADLSFTAGVTSQEATDAAFVAYGDANMPVPQTLAASTQQLTIGYSMTTTGGVNMGHKTKVVDLLGTDVTAWAVNTKYTYNILIDLDKIYFNPTIVEWTEGASQQIDVQ